MFWLISIVNLSPFVRDDMDTPLSLISFLRPSITPIFILLPSILLPSWSKNIPPFWINKLLFANTSLSSGLVLNSSSRVIDSLNSASNTEVALLSEKLLVRSLFMFSLVVSWSGLVSLTYMSAKVLTWESTPENFSPDSRAYPLGPIS